MRLDMINIVTLDSDCLGIIKLGPFFVLQRALMNLFYRQA